MSDREPGAETLDLEAARQALDDVLPTKDTAHAATVFLGYALCSEVRRLREQVAQLEAETPEWTPLSAAMQKLYEVWDLSEAPNASTEDLIFAAEDACGAWKAYRQARFGNVAASPSPAPGDQEPCGSEPDAP